MWVCSSGAFVDLHCGIVYDTDVSGTANLDTNVVIAGLRSSQGASHQLLRALAAGHFRIGITVPLFVEYEKAVANLVDEGILDQKDGVAVLDFLASVAEHREVFFLWRPMLRDPEDEMVLEAAVACQARQLVTHNTRDFRGAERVGVSILKPAEFLLSIRRSR